ncbi:hypothetical protein [Alloscardovia macacae]|uniref:Uncharacterized protein n=1 Tax=Alloscardovia macacae TaxID=1160091 RepID=A0A261F6Y3_9BIFI|nr:hypothetical protein [Alloscardovia macacae]OZG54838.1 hypothetical protein ALMA_0163 [Alloscardovia macacae]
MVTTKRFYYALIGALTALAICFSTMVLSHASTLPTGAEPSSSSLTYSEESALEKDVEILFTRYIELTEEDIFIVNDTHLRADGFDQSSTDLHRLADTLNRLPHDTSTPSLITSHQRHIKPMGIGEFALCVAMDGIGLPRGKISSGLINAIKTGIKAWNWGLTARTVARILGASLVKSLGGPVGIGIALASAAWNCRGSL